MPKLLDVTLPSLADTVRTARRAFTAEYQAIGLSAFVKNNATYALAWIVARMQMQMYLASREYASQAAPFGATGANLDSYLQLYGVTIPAPEKASGSVDITGGGNLSVDSGTIITFNELQYKTTQAANFGAGPETIEVTAEALAVGSEYNRAAGELLDLAFIVDGIEPSAVVVTMSGGQGAPTEASKEALLQAAFQRSQSSGTAGDYRLKSLQFDSQFLDVFVVEAGEGAGTVSLYPINVLTAGQESYEVNLPSAGQISALQTYIEKPTVRKTNDRMFVFALTVTPYDFDLTISPDNADTRAAATEALGSRLAEEYTGKGYTIANSELNAAVGGASGISSHTINDIGGAGGAVDITAIQGELATLGMVTFS